MKLIICAVGLMAGLVGCGTLDRAYNKEVRWEDRPAVQVMTNEMLRTNVVARVLERTNIVWVTNEMTGYLTGYMSREPIATNYVEVVETSTVPVFVTNLVRVPRTNFVARPEAEAIIQGTGSVVNAFLPGMGSVLALVFGGIYHGYRQMRNRKINEALIQGVETARAVLETTPQGQAANAQFVKWLMDHQKEAGVFATVSDLVDRLSDNPAAKAAAQEMAERLRSVPRERAE